MDTIATNKIGRQRKAAERKADKRAEKKRELAQSAIVTLSQLGYANTSLRDIAEQSGVSVGVIHYYFEDRVDLIAYCVQQYKFAFVQRMKSIIDATPENDALPANFIDGLAKTIEEEAASHRLWYDMRVQALFDEHFRVIVNDIESSLIGIVAKFLTRMNAQDVDPVDVYTVLDGSFRYHLQQHVQGRKGALDDFRASLARLLGGLGFSG